jgi:putative ABC transport system permease protein
MGMLDRKLRRDLWRLRGQALAIALLVAVGVATFTGAISTYRSLYLSQHRYYELYRFPHAFAMVQRAPEPVADRLLEIQGVAEVQTRVVAPASLEVEGIAEPATALLVSIPDGSQPRMARLHLREGRLPDPGRPWEVVVHEAFAKANRMRPGQTLPAVVRGHREVLSVVGVALAPDFVYAVRPGDLLPDDRRFGIFWVQRTTLAAAMDMDGAFNDVALRLADDASQPQVLAAVDRVLAPYGCPGAGGRDRNVSHRFLSDEIKQLKSTAVTIPTMFLGVAAFLLHVILSRLVTTQREQIGTMKALGLSNREVGAHYALLVGLVVAAGLAVGAGLGAWIGTWWTRMYSAYYRMPLYVYVMEPDVILQAVALSLAAGALGVRSAVRQAICLPPAEAMRPPAPPVFRRSLLERLVPGQWLTPAGRMVLRNLGRRPVRALLSSLGMAFAVAILITGVAMLDSMDLLMDVQFGRAYRDDVTVAFTDPSHPESLDALKAIPGVRVAEGFRSVPVTFRAGNREYATVVNGLPAGGELRRVTDLWGRAVPIPGEGVMLTKALADLLHVAAGDTVTTEVMEGRRPRWDLVVTATADEALGSQGWMDLDALQGRLDDGGTLTGASLRVDADRRDGLFRDLRAMPRVAGVTVLPALRKSFDDLMAQFLVIFVVILTGFAALMAAGVVYNAARVTLAERERELASLRVLGFTRREAFGILAGELGVQLLLALPAGCALGWAFSWATAAGVSNDMYRIAATVERSTFAAGCGVVVATAALVALAMRRRVARLDLVAVLKTRE